MSARPEPLLLMARVHRQAAHAIILQVRVVHHHGRGNVRALSVLDPKHMLNVQRPNRRLRHPRRSKVHRVQRLRELRRPAVKPLVVRPVLAQDLDADVTFAMSRGLCCGRAVGSHRRCGLGELRTCLFGVLLICIFSFDTFPSDLSRALEVAHRPSSAPAVYVSSFLPFPLFLFFFPFQLFPSSSAFASLSHFAGHLRHRRRPRGAGEQSSMYVCIYTYI
jgi:hypothetical protein